ncbi:TetR/AcrR family transcriptional regulator C-terminal domain-containing protein, partial [Frankia sp. CiP1_Cm_nod2]|uniref:TetR/AcrR family transcriptional regulator C-terminal domain-containing protein n=1 Tax=Frankia sp. CiP1_Cm_nod2 TaxID=2897161 RepID=UPI0020248A83
SNRGHLDVDGPDTAAARFLALVSGDLPELSALGTSEVTDAELRTAIAADVNTFLRAFAPTRHLDHPPQPPTRRQTREVVVGDRHVF